MPSGTPPICRSSSSASALLGRMRHGDFRVLPERPDVPENIEMDILLGPGEGHGRLALASYLVLRPTVDLTSRGTLSLAFSVPGTSRTSSWRRSCSASSLPHPLPVGPAGAGGPLRPLRRRGPGHPGLRDEPPERVPSPGWNAPRAFAILPSLTEVSRHPDDRGRGVPDLHARRQVPPDLPSRDRGDRRTGRCGRRTEPARRPLSPLTAVVSGVAVFLFVSAIGLTYDGVMRRQPAPAKPAPAKASDVQMSRALATFRMPPEIVFAQSPDSPAPVTFKHAVHVDAGSPECSSCHQGGPNAFSMVTRRRRANRPPPARCTRRAGSATTAPRRSPSRPIARNATPSRPGELKQMHLTQRETGRRMED